MQIQLLDESKDWEETLPVLSLAREKGGLRIATPVYTIFIDPFEEFSEAVVELVGHPDQPEPRRPERVHSLEELLTKLVQER